MVFLLDGKTSPETIIFRPGSILHTETHPSQIKYKTYKTISTINQIYFII